MVFLYNAVNSMVPGLGSWDCGCDEQ